MRNSLIINTILGKPPKLVNTTYLLVAKKKKKKSTSLESQQFSRIRT